MAIYSAYLPPNSSASDDNGTHASDTFKLVSDAKAPLALVFPPFWLIWHRLWLELLLYVVFAIAVAMLAAWKPSPPILYLSALPGLFLLLEGNAMVARKLERKGWRFAGIVDGETLEDAEIRFIVQNQNSSQAAEPAFETAQPEEDGKRVASFRPSSTPLGLFPE